MSETIVLDPPAIATARTQLDITSWVAASGTGIDWGDAAIQAYTASVTVGEVRLGYRLPNRQIKIPLVLRNVGATTFAAIRQQLQAKVGLLQRENGWLGRTTDAGTLYVDVQNATLHLGGSWLQAYRGADIDAVLSLECLPDWYGDEVILSDHVETTLPHLFFTEATINGNHPGRVRIVMDNDSSFDQHGLLWGFRSRYYNAATTAALFYEAEQLQGINGGAGTAFSGASGGSALTQPSLPSNSWVSVLSTNMMPGTVALTHNGSYRVWARCYGLPEATPAFRLLWGVGSLSVPTINDAVQVPTTGKFYMLDLGEIHLEPPPTGPNQWFGTIQTQTAAPGQSASIDCVYFQPLDDGAGRLVYAGQSPPASSIVVTGTPTVAANDAAVGSVAWTGTGSALDGPNGAFASVSLTGAQTSNYLKLTGYGFAVPSGVTITGIQAQYYVTNGPGGGSWTPTAKLAKAGVVTGTATLVNIDTYAFGRLFTLGGPTDLWGTTWASTDINNTGFGAAFSVAQSSGGPILQYVDYIAITVYFTLATGFTVAPDAVIAASKTIELRTDGMYRQGGGGTIYAPVSQVIGDLPRVPPSGLEGRAVQVFLKPSQGDFNGEIDAGIDDVSARLVYRPSYLYTP